MHHLCRRVELLFWLECELLFLIVDGDLIDPFPTSMCALAVLKNGLLRISDILESRCISSTTKSMARRSHLS